MVLNINPVQKWFSLIFTMCVLVGCGSSADGVVRYPVTGTVTWNGQPLPEGDIIFIPTEKTARPEGAVIKEGQFELTLAPGSMRVEIRASRETGKMIESAVDPGQKIAVVENYIPAKYNDKSELKAEVSADGENQFQFELAPQ
tara:strand:+ start:41405 stop:41833 length:429 start_codon:yes stop_codon:yes gene_type:complete